MDVDEFQVAAKDAVDYSQSRLEIWQQKDNH